MLKQNQFTWKQETTQARLECMLELANAAQSWFPTAWGLSPSSSSGSHHRLPVRGPPAPFPTQIPALSSISTRPITLATPPSNSTKSKAGLHHTGPFLLVSHLSTGQPTTVMLTVPLPDPHPDWHRVLNLSQTHLYPPLPPPTLFHLPRCSQNGSLGRKVSSQLLPTSTLHCLSTAPRTRAIPSRGLAHLLPTAQPSPSLTAGPRAYTGESYLLELSSPPHPVAPS